MSNLNEEPQSTLSLDFKKTLFSSCFDGKEVDKEQLKDTIDKQLAEIPDSSMEDGERDLLSQLQMAINEAIDQQNWEFGDIDGALIEEKEVDTDDDILVDTTGVIKEIFGNLKDEYTDRCQNQVIADIEKIICSAMDSLPEESDFKAKIEELFFN